MDGIAQIDSVIAHLSAASPVPDATSRRKPEQSPKAAERESVEAPTAAQLQSIADEVTSSTGNSLAISIHEETGRFVVRVSDGNGEILRQFPSESALGLASRLQDLRGVLFEGSAA